MMTPDPLRIAIVGAGPSGCYLAQALTRTSPGCEITIFDREIAPYGLIRSGVAADHQHTKQISRQFERVLQQPNIEFAGNIHVLLNGDLGPSDSDASTHDHASISLTDLHHNYDAVALATGLPSDQALAIPGATCPGVYGAHQIIRVLNAAPGAAEQLPQLGTDVVIIGLGNVAIDLLRFLVKTEAGYTQSDVSEQALNSYVHSPAQRITVLSRSDARDLKADASMLAELDRLPRAQYRVAAFGGAMPAEHEFDELSPTQRGRLEALKSLTRTDRPTYPGPLVTLMFQATPVEISGDAHVTAVEAQTSGGTTDFAESVHIPATAVLTAVGFTEALHTSHSADSTVNAENADSTPVLYKTGWARRGPRGGIPANRTCAKTVAADIAHDLAQGTLTVDPQKLGFNGLPLSVRQHAVSFAQWQQLDAHEVAEAAPDRVRRKSPHRAVSLAIATGASPSGTSHTYTIDDSVSTLREKGTS